MNKFISFVITCAVLTGLLLAACHKHEEQPAVSITGFNPTRGVVDSVVTISGNNFSTTASTNVVKFNGVTATVTNATKTSLRAKVPQGATTGKITVTVENSTATSADDFTVLVLAPPTITGLTPAAGAAVGATVIIAGTNFDATGTKNTVKFNGTTTTVTQASATSLTVTVPAGATTGKVTVTVNGLTATSASDFTVYQAPTIASTSPFTPASAVAGTDIVISGTNFDATAANNVVKFYSSATNSVSVTATVKTATATSLTVTVPAGAATGKVSVTVHTLTATSAGDFTVVVPTIALSVNSGAIGKAITITGNFSFDATAANNVVMFNNVVATITSATTTQLVAEVPYGVALGAATVSVSVNGGNPVNAPSNFTVVSAWTRKADMPAPGNFNYGYSIGNKGYVGGGVFSINNALQNNRIFEYDQASDTWSAKSNSPGSSFNLGFAIGNIGYEINTAGTVSSFDPTSNLWTSPLNSGQAAPVNSSSSTGTFVIISGQAYIKQTSSGDFYSFNPSAANNQGSFSNINFAYPDGATDITVGAGRGQQGFVINGKGYVGGGANSSGTLNTFYKFDPSIGWVKLNDLQSHPVTMFSIGSFGYMIDNNNHFFRYDLLSDRWTQLEDITANAFTNPASFVIGQKGYVTGGNYIVNLGTWEYDPSK